ncbi:MAG: heme exporter protein CcmD [Alphaproteobacteria bacterium]|jgi:heme exporter protein D|nr:heme exporter protein CcmD [Alphaproteobacteria bacterium]MDP6588996.1 heme exporter protein CcmD [Alphaproteobacteria bacterium]MDP6816989.1 heme exporter protein CcmD [Alphaproteobacteria bacterium]
MSFFEMGGYAAYIWPAFGVGALVLIGLLVISLRRLKSREAALLRLEAAGGGRRRRGRGDGDEEDAETEKEEASP